MTNDPISLLLLMFALGMVPVFFILTTSFIKVAMVCILTRESLGVQSVPPNIVIYSLSLILAFYVMGPVYNQTYTTLSAAVMSNQPITPQLVITEFQKSTVPVKQFLIKHSSVNERTFFYQSLKRFWSPQMLSDVKMDDLIIIVPAFVVSEITEGFKIGFLVYLPSVIIDIIVSNILMAMGMMMMSPVTISLPIKLLLFISINGWHRLIQSLLGTY